MTNPCLGGCRLIRITTDPMGLDPPLTVYSRHHRCKACEQEEKYSARRWLQHSVAAGRVSKPDTCEECGGHFESRDLHGHHEDYAKPLEVVWLCRTCHGKRHRA